MQCPECNQERQQNEFMNGKCFRCVYREKLKVADQTKLCKMCDKKVNKGRWIFCSNECFKEYSKINNNTHWSKKIHIESKSWKKNRDFLFSSGPNIS
jgi:hypothetical protein